MKTDIKEMDYAALSKINEAAKKRREREKKERDAKRWPLDLPLINFSPYPADIWTLADSFQGVAIFGENGSGKTSGSGQLLARKYLKAGYGGIVLCFKTDEADLWRKYLKDTGREEDGRFFSVDGPFRFNFLQHESESSGVDFSENLVTLLVDISSIRRRTEAKGSNENFWEGEKKKLLRNAISMFILSGEPVRLRTLYRALSNPQISQELYDRIIEIDAWDTPELELIKDYWMRERLVLDPKTKATIDSDFTGMFDPLTRGKIGELFGTETNLSPDDTFAGKIIVIDIPVARYREIGQYAALIWSQLFQRAVDRRTYNAPNDRPVFLWVDEAQYFTIEQDALFQTTARSKGISVVRLTQNLPNFLDAYGRDGKHKVDTLLGNHATKIFHRNGDPTTNEWAAKVIGKELAYKHSMSNSGSLQSNSGFNASASVSETYEESCQPFEFLNLKNGGHKNQCRVEAILFQSGRLWRKDQRWTTVNFQQ